MSEIFEDEKIINDEDAKLYTRDFENNLKSVEYTTSIAKNILSLIEEEKFYLSELKKYITEIKRKETDLKLNILNSHFSTLKSIYKCDTESGKKFDLFKTKPLLKICLCICIEIQRDYMILYDIVGSGTVFDILKNFLIQTNEILSFLTDFLV